MGSVPEMYDHFCIFLDNAYKRNIPSMTFYYKGRKRTPGVTAAEASTILEKNRAWTRFMETKSEAKHREYTR
jgi:hypothetical protein